MKTLAVACVVFSAVFVVASAADEWKKALDTCLAEKNLSKDEFKSMLENQDDNAMCLFACADKKLKVFDGEKFDIDLVHKIMTEKFASKGKEYTANIRDKMTECCNAGNDAPGDECAKHKVLMNCLFEFKSEFKDVE